MADQRTSLAGVEDLLVNILKRLPVKCLGRFRCVCKSWSSLISSRFFLTSHHNFTVSNTKKSYFMLYYFHKNPVLLEYDVYHPQQEVGECITYLAPPYSTDLMDPYKCPFPCARFTVTGVINGVACLHTSRNIVVWNPSIHKHIILRYHGDVSLRGFVGFGFNADDNDFKVVVFLCGSGPWYDVLSVQDGFWRRRPLPNYIYQNYCPGSNSCFVNGTLYWMVRNSHNDSTALLLFDCKREEFKTKEIFPAELPKYIDPFTFCPFKHGDMLSMLISAPGGGFELWAMEEEGYTWSKLYTLGESFIETGFRFMPRRGINFCSDDLPTGLGEFHQPLDSQAFEESLFLMDVKGQFPPQLAPCLYCSCDFRSVVYSLV